MEKIPKIQDLKPPGGYFEELPDRIMDRLEPRSNFGWIKYAAAAAVILSLGVWQFMPTDTTDENLALNQEIELYIDSNYWSAEDLLTMSDNPEEILDEIISEEMPYLEEDIWLEEDQNWFE